MQTEKQRERLVELLEAECGFSRYMTDDEREELLPPLVEPKGKTITIPRWRYNEHKGESE